MPHLTFDHAVLVVDDLDDAVRDYQTLGFHVTPGGTHAGGWTHNALIGLADGGYLELIATVQPRHTALLRTLHQHGALHLLQPDFPLVQQRFMHSIALGEGFQDFALLATALDAQIEAANEVGLLLEGPLDGARRRPDGVQLAWRFGLPPDSSLPFLIDDVTPRERRVPAATRDAHPNGAVGVAEVLFAVRDLGAMMAKFAALLNLEAEQASGKGGKEENAARFALTESFALTLVAATDASSELASFIEMYGERPYKLRLWTEDAARAGRLDAGLSHQAGIELVATR